MTRPLVPSELRQFMAVGDGCLTPWLPEIQAVVECILAARLSRVEAEALLDAAMDYDYSGDPVLWLESRADDLAAHNPRPHDPRKDGRRQA